MSWAGTAAISRLSPVVILHAQPGSGAKSAPVAARLSWTKAGGGHVSSASLLHCVRAIFARRSKGRTCPAQWCGSRYGFTRNTVPKLPGVL